MIAWMLGGALTIVLAAWWIRRTLLVVTVTGSSMTPALHAGDRLLVVRRRRRRRLRRGQIVVLAGPSRDNWDGPAPAQLPLDSPHWLVKRVVALSGDPIPPTVPGAGAPVPEGHLIVLGDNPASADSKQRGPCPEQKVLGVVRRRLSPSPSRAHAQSIDQERSCPTS